MNASQFIQINSWLVQNQHQPLRHEEASAIATQQLWPHAKVRNQRWIQSLDDLKKLTVDAEVDSPVWLQLTALAQEIILSESLIRVWFAIASIRFDDRDVDDIGQYLIAENQLARKRVVELMDQAPEFVQSRLAKIRELHGMSERVTDLMLSQLTPIEAARPFAISAAIFDEFAKCARGYNDQTIKRANALLGRSFAQGIAERASQISFNPDLNEKVVSDILALFSPGASAVERSLDTVFAGS